MVVREGFLGRVGSVGQVSATPQQQCHRPSIYLTVDILTCQLSKHPPALVNRATAAKMNRFAIQKKINWQLFSLLFNGLSHFPK